MIVKTIFQNEKDDIVFQIFSNYKNEISFLMSYGPELLARTSFTKEECEQIVKSLQTLIDELESK